MQKEPRGRLFHCPRSHLSVAHLSPQRPPCCVGPSEPGSGAIRHRERGRAAWTPPVRAPNHSLQNQGVGEKVEPPLHPPKPGGPGRPRSSSRITSKGNPRERLSGAPQAAKANSGIRVSRRVAGSSTITCSKPKASLREIRSEKPDPGLGRPLLQKEGPEGTRPGRPGHALAQGRSLPRRGRPRPSSEGAGSPSVARGHTSNLGSNDP